MLSTTLHEYLEPCCQIAREAGELIMTYYSGHYTTQRKEDHSPVTDADIAANAHITTALAKLAPDICVIAEEDESLPETARSIFFLVDPLDGTRSFVRHEPEFTVNIGLIKDHMPWFGVIYIPATEAMYFGEVGKGAFRQLKGGKIESIESRIVTEEGLIVVRSRSHPSAKTAAYLETLAIKEIQASSSSAKFCYVAEGNADLYPRFGRTMEWDTAAGHAILKAAGGRVETVDGQPLTYGKPGFENPAFIAYGK